MKIPRKPEKEVRAVYEAYWDSYFNGDMKTMASFIDDDFKVIGSTDGEVFFNKKETMKFYEDTTDQITGKVELRNRNIEEKLVDGLVLFTEMSDLYILIEDEWVLYSKVRLSSLLKKNEECWKFIQQHGSIPDSKAQEGEQVAFDKISRENLELRDAVKRRTIELENKNRELEIETSLERVRAVALSMKEPSDMLDVCRVISDQLELLKLEDIRNIQTAIINEPKGIYLNYEYFTPYKRTSLLEIEINLHPIVVEFVNEIKKSDDAFFTKTIEGEALKDWREYRRKTNQDPDPILDEEKAVHYYFYSIGPGALGISSFSPLNEEDISVFKRFRNVFTLAYRRFIDIEQAEAQAREAQIEAALERVRSKTMAMHNSQDAGAAVVKLFEEVMKLGIDKSIRCGIGILDKATDHMETWSATSYPNGEIDLKMGMLDMRIHPMLIGLKKAWQNNESNYSYDYIGDDVTLYYEALNKEPEYPFYVDLDTLPENEYHKSFFYTEGILFAFTANPISEEAAKVLNRFAGVFGQTYRRYLDLKKAEAQAREAQIEASLERVRTLAMSMHKSDDLTKAVATVFTELSHLGLNTIRCGIGIMQGKNKMVDAWTTSSADEKNSIHVSGDEKLEGHPLLDKIYAGWQNQKDTSYLLQGEDLENYYDYTSTSNLKVPAPALKAESAVKSKQYYHCVMFPAGGLYAFRDKEFSGEAKMLMRRFTDVFHLAFTRHLDLKQAEEQNKIIQSENERKTQELEEARELQLAMLPEELPNLPHLDIAVYMQTATEVGGDYYDFSLKEDGSINIAIGDATGHGMKAGIMVSSMKSIFTTNSPKMDIESFFATANSGVKSMGLRRMMMGFTMLNINKHTFKLINAGMPPIFLFHKKSNVVEELTEHGMPIGAMNHSHYSITSCTLEKGDVLLLMSDGMPELHNDKHEMYGYDRIKDLLGKVNGYESEEIITQLKEEASAWINDQAPDDDVTFVVIKVK